MSKLMEYASSKKSVSAQFYYTFENTTNDIHPAALRLSLLHLISFQKRRLYSMSGINCCPSCIHREVCIYSSKLESLKNIVKGKHEDLIPEASLILSCPKHELPRRD